MRNRKSNNSTLLNSACAIVFILFVFLYLYFFQADLLFMVQHVLSGGTTHYDKTIGTVVITLVLYFVHVGVMKLGDFGVGGHVFSYIPSFLLLIALTCVDSDFDENPYSGGCLWVSLSLLILYIAVVSFLRVRRSLPVFSGTGATPVGLLWKNLLLMSLMCIVVCLCGNSERVFHYRLRVERLLMSGNYADALKVGDKSDDADPSLTMLRIYALSRERLLGERLFEYPLSGGSQALLPDGKDVRCLFYPERRIFKVLSIRKKGSMSPMAYLQYIERNGLAMKSAADYMLCGYLLDKDIDGFVRAIQRKYDISSPSLPKHYKEALTLYTHQRANPAVVYHNEVMDADYADMQALERKYPDKRECESYVRDTYGDTYWFYYFYGKRK